MITVHKTSVAHGTWNIFLGIYADQTPDVFSYAWTLVDVQTQNLKANAKSQALSCEQGLMHWPLLSNIFKSSSLTQSFASLLGFRRLVISAKSLGWWSVINFIWNILTTHKPVSNIFISFTYMYLPSHVFICFYSLPYCKHSLYQFMISKCKTNVTLHCGLKPKCKL